MNKIVWIAIGIVGAIIAVAAIVMAAGDDSAGNMNNSDIQNAEPQDINNGDNPESPDPVKQETGTSDDIDQSPTGNANTLMNPDRPQ